LTRRSDFFAVFVFVLVVIGGGFAASRSYFFPKISADIENTGATREIIENGNFTKESFNSLIWSKFSNGAGNDPVVENGTLKFGIKNTIKDGYQIIAQPVTLHIGKSYTISIEYIEYKENEALAASEGFVSGTILGKPIFEKDFSKAVFTPIEEVTDAFFFLKVKASKPALLEITNVSVVESSPLAASPSATSIRTVAPTPTAAAFATKTITPAPTATQTPTSTTAPLVFPPRWSFIGFTSAINTAPLTKANLKIYSMHSGKWRVASSQTKGSDFNVLAQDGLYIFNPQETEVKIDLPSSAQIDKAVYPSTGWNLLYSSKSTPVSAKDFEVDLGKEGLGSIASLTEQNSAANAFYVLKQTKDGVALENGDFLKDTVPAKTAFWLYLF